jgi:hypothetical protein
MSDTPTTPRSVTEAKTSLLGKVEQLFREVDHLRDHLAEIANEELTLAAVTREREALRAEVAALRAESQRLADPLRSLAKMKANLSA